MRIIKLYEIDHFGQQQIYEFTHKLMTWREKEVTEIEIVGKLYDAIKYINVEYNRRYGSFSLIKNKQILSTIFFDDILTLYLNFVIPALVFEKSDKLLLILKNFVYDFYYEYREYILDFIPKKL